MTDTPRTGLDPASGPADPGPEAPGGAPATEVPAAGGRGRKGYFLPGFIALVALLLIGAAVGAGDLSHPAPKTLTGSDVAAQIAMSVQAERNTSALPQVTCPRSEPVRAGYRFQCALATAPGHTEPISVTEVDGRGRLQWSLGVAQPSK